MNTKALTSRFKRKTAAAPNPVAGSAAEAKPPVATEAAPAPEAAAAVAAERPAETVVAEAADSPAASAGPAADGAAAPPPRPARLVEGMAPKLDRKGLDLAGLAARGRSALTMAKPAGVPLAAAAAIVLAIGAGYGLGSVGRERDAVDAARWSEVSGEIGKSGREIARLGSELDAVRTALDGLKTARDGSRGDGLARQAQLLEKLDRLGQETSSRVARLTEQVERVEKTQRDPSRLAALSEKLDRIEKGMVTASAPPPPLPPARPLAASAPPPAPDVSQTGSLAEPKPAKVETDPRKIPIEGFYVRDYDEGMALIETRNGRYIDVAVGYSIPGLGRVEAIERRGRHWIVVTSKGYIGER